MENENFDLEQKPVSANKDLWLFLIVVDIVFLCVCGFFLYKNLSARFFMPVEETEVVAEEQAAAQPDLLAEVLPETKKETKKETKTPAAPAVKAPKVQEIAAEPVVVVPEPVAEPAPKADEQEQPAEQAEKPFTSGIISMFADVCKIISILVVIWFQNRGLTLVLLVLLPFLFWFTRHVQKNMLAAQIENRKAVGRASGHVPETLHNIRTIHCLAKEAYMEERYDTYIGESYAAMERTNFYDAVCCMILDIMCV